MAAPPVDELDSRAVLLRRVRCVAFAALGEGISEAELLEAVKVAVLADRRRRDQPTTPPYPGLRLVTD